MAAISLDDRSRWIENYMKKNGVNRYAAQSAWRTAKSDAVKAATAKAKAAEAAKSPRVKWVENYMKENNVGRYAAQSAWRQTESATAKKAAAKVEAKAAVEASKKAVAEGGRALKVAGSAMRPAVAAAKFASKAAGPLGVAAGLYDSASTLADKKKLASAAVGRRAVMDAAAGKMNKSDSMFDTAAKARKMALAKKAAAARVRGTMIPADRGSRGKNTSRTYTEGRRADNASSRPTSTKSTPNASKTPSGASTHVVKRGDTLWDIAQANNTTVSTLLKLNPQIAQRKAEGKTTIFSGSKVRIPKGK